MSFDKLIHATGSTGTQAGLVTGLEGVNSKLQVLGVSVRQSKEKQIDAVWKLIKKTTEKLDIPEITRDKVLVEDGYVGEGYGIPTKGTLEAITLLAQKESILLDPVYSGKGMAGLIDLIRKGILKKGQKVLFLHTGGSTALFAYEKELLFP